MRTWLRRIGTVLLFTVIAICFAPTLMPIVLDRVYYEGPRSDHFDGERFFNPDSPSYNERPRQRFISRWIAGDERTPWPESVPVAASVPPARVNGREMLVTWVGHATVLVQTQGLNILTDPIWSERASPFSFVGPKRVRAPGVRFEDLPKIDLVVVSHAHYDHMDLPTLKRLWKRDRPLIVSSLGNDTILRAAGVEASVADWGGRVPVRGGVEVIVERNHHWASRWGVDRNRALWSAFTVRLPGGSIFFGGDTGFGDGSWVKEASRNGPFRLAIIPIGAYEPRDFMKDHHINPEEAVRIFETLKPVMGLGVHWGTFQLTFEGIADPPHRLAELKRARGISAERFVATDVGRSFSVPEFPAARGASAQRAEPGSEAESPSAAPRRPGRR